MRLGQISGGGKFERRARLVTWRNGGPRRKHKWNKGKWGRRSKLHGNLFRNLRRVGWGVFFGQLAAFVPPRLGSLGTSDVVFLSSVVYCKDSFSHHTPQKYDLFLFFHSMMWGGRGFGNFRRRGGAFVWLCKIELNKPTSKWVLWSPFFFYFSKVPEITRRSKEDSFMSLPPPFGLEIATWLEKFMRLLIPVRRSIEMYSDPSVSAYVNDMNFGCWSVIGHPRHLTFTLAWENITR